MKKEFRRHQSLLAVDILNFIRSNILSLLKFEDIFFSVDDFNGVRSGHHLSHISSFQPPIGCDRLLSHVGLFVVAQEDLGTSNPNLAPWTYVPMLIMI